jgi:hypothetical protein
VRWLWQYAARLAGSRVWSEAKQAAVDKVASANDDDDLPSDGAGTAMGVVCETKRLFDAVADVLSSQRRVEADRFAVCVGTLSDKQVVVTRPLTTSPNVAQLITAIVDGHHPQFLLSASEAASRSAEVPPGSIVVASRVIDKDGRSLRLDGAAPAAAGFFTGGLATCAARDSIAMVDLNDAPLAEDSWSESVARACQQSGVAMMAIGVVMQPVAELRSREAESLKKQASLAGRAGVLTGMLWKKRSGLREVWSEKEAAWEACSRLAKLVAHLAKAAGK